VKRDGLVFADLLPTVDHTDGTRTED
jgi:hypothetical protein